MKNNFESEVKKYVEYLKKYPSFINEIMELHNSYNLNQLKEFIKNVDFSINYDNEPTHENYIEYKEIIDNIILDENAYDFDIKEINQNYMDDNHSITIYNKSYVEYDNIIETFWPFTKVLREKAVKALAIEENSRILEIGTGPGSNFEFYSTAGEIIGIDFSEKVVEVAEEKAKKIGRNNIKMLQMDAHKTDFPDNHFDGVLFFTSLCVVNNPYKVLKEAKRICKEEGKIVIYEPILSPELKVRLLQYLMQPICKKLGHVWYKGFPANAVPYNTWLDKDRLIESLNLKVDSNDISFQLAS